MRISDWSSDVCSSDLPSLEHRLEATARAHGFAAFGIAPADAAPETAARLNAWLADGCHGDMIWMESRAAQRGSPQGLWPDVRPVIAPGLNYAPAAHPLALADHPGRPDSRRVGKECVNTCEYPG